MIPFPFLYYRPDTLKEAAEVFAQVQSEGKSPVYYAGGSETITLCRAGSIQPDAVIDIKWIGECNALSLDDRSLHIGANCSLSQISRSGLFPLLGLACGRIADHTNQCRITLGGNLCGSIIYRETSLPLLLADADITLYGLKGERTLPFQSVFDGRMQLDPGELVVGIHIPSWALSARHFHIKRTANEKIDYPLVSVAAIYQEGWLRIGFSGVCPFPFRSEKIEGTLNDRTKSAEERAKLASSLLPEAACTTVEGTEEYRIFVLQNTLQELLREVENGQV